MFKRIQSFNGYNPLFHDVFVEFYPISVPVEEVVNDADIEGR